MKKLILFLMLSAFVLSLSASKHYVTKNGSNIANNGSADNSWLTIANALSKCNSGDIIIIGEGVFTENSIVVTKPVTIKGKSLINSTKVDISGLKTGMYILSVKVGSESHASYFIKN